MDRLWEEQTKFLEDFMRNATPYFGLFIFGLIFFLAWLNGYLLARWFPVYRSRRGRYGYWLATIISSLIVGYLWVVRPPAAADYYAFRAMALAAFVWIVGQLVLLFLLPFIGLLQRLTSGGRGERAETAGGEPISRRSFIQGAVAATPVLAFGLSAQGVFEAEAGMVVQRYDLPFPQLPSGLSGFKIVQISDAHLGPYFSLEKLEDALEKARKEKPDLLAVTGDFVDDLSLLGPAFDRLGELSREIPCGTYFCWGNHEYFRNIDQVRAALDSSPVRLLENSNALIDAGERPFYLMGVDYPWAKDPQERQAICRQFFNAAKQGIPDGAFTVLLAHHPDFITEGFDAGIPLTLTGHTHGGQVALFGKTLLPISYRYMRGMYHSGGCRGYVSTGTGHWFPFRFGCPAEIGVFRLVKN
ncbi:MAG TPA: metallophosphoesterase [Selenomonadales bacterium]|nr:metallophosphoesterase [Selenomonadales bacterium]